MSVSVLVVEDETEIRRFVRLTLEAEGLAVAEAGSVERGLIEAGTRRPDLVVLDLGLPDGDGIAFITGLRAWSDSPVIVLSARAGEDDKVRALDAGADDYLVKPFGSAELLARVRAQLRRSGAEPTTVLRFADLTIDLERRQVVQGEREVRLTPTEMALLELLALNAGKPVTLDQMIARVWKGAPGTTNDTVRVHVGTLRRKLEPDPSRPCYVVSEPWVGYRFIAEPL